ncbi:hypothetical protein V8C26DRAFT_398708 [Trichoderma gracile]
MTTLWFFIFFPFQFRIVLTADKFTMSRFSWLRPHFAADTMTIWRWFVFGRHFTGHRSSCAASSCSQMTSFDSQNEPFSVWALERLSRQIWWQHRSVLFSFLSGDSWR